MGSVPIPENIPSFVPGGFEAGVLLSEPGKQKAFSNHTYTLGALFHFGFKNKADWAFNQKPVRLTGVQV